MFVFLPQVVNSLPEVSWVLFVGSKKIFMEVRLHYTFSGFNYFFVNFLYFKIASFGCCKNIFLIPRSLGGGLTKT